MLLGETKGYRNHPQLTRFQEQPEPLAAIGRFLDGVQEDATKRGYNFNASKIVVPDAAGVPQIPVTTGQLAYEWEHLGKKLAKRSPEFPREDSPTPHPLFVVVPGGVADWEVTG